MTLYAQPGSAGSQVTVQDRYGHFIAGNFVEPKKGEYFENISPVNGKVFTHIARGTAEDIDALNAVFLAAMEGQPWEVAWVQANAGRTRMLEEWSVLDQAADEASWWIRKSGGDHYADHLDRLREWVAELIERRRWDTSTPPA